MLSNRQINYLSLRLEIVLHLFFAFIAALLFLPILSNELIPLTNRTDYLNHFAAIVQAKQAIMERQFPLRIAPLEQSGYLYPYYQFYSSVSYFFAGMIYKWLTPNNPFLAYKLTLWLALLIGTHYIYRLAFKITEMQIAAGFAGFIFLSNPYFPVLINHYGSFNEVLAITILPIIVFYSLIRCQNPKNEAGILQASFCWSLLATVHTITFIFASIFILAFFLFFTLCKQYSYKSFISIVLSYIFGCLLAAWYLAPIAFYAKYLAVYASFDNITTSLLRPSLSALFSLIPMQHAEINTPQFRFYFDLIPNIGVPTLFIATISLIFLFRRTNNLNYIWLFLSIVSFCLLIILMTSNVWLFLPNHFLVIQYPWRLLVQLTWISALLTACVMQIFLQQNYFYAIIAFFILISISFSTWLFIPERLKFNVHNFESHPVLAAQQDSYLITPQNYVFINSIDRMQIFPGLQVQGFINTEQAISLPIAARFCNLKANKVSCKIQARKNQLIELPILFYPDMLRIKQNNAIVDFKTILHGKKIIIAIDAIDGINDITVEFLGLEWANYLSKIGWQLWILFLVFILLRSKNGLWNSNYETS